MLASWLFPAYDCYIVGKLEIPSFLKAVFFKLRIWVHCGRDAGSTQCGVISAKSYHSTSFKTPAMFHHRGTQCALGSDTARPRG